MNTSIRFIIITVLPDDVARGFDHARRLACEVGRSRASLAYPPHVTLRTGALVPVEHVSAFIQELDETLGAWDSFPVTADGFVFSQYEDGEERKYLAGYRVRKDPSLTSLNARLLRLEKWRASNRLLFEPHLTLAFDDLDRKGFQDVQRWLEANPGALPSSFSWLCENVCLYTRTGDQWTLYREWRSSSDGGYLHSPRWGTVRT